MELIKKLFLAVVLLAGVTCVRGSVTIHNVDGVGTRDFQWDNSGWISVVPPGSWVVGGDTVCPYVSDHWRILLDDNFGFRYDTIYSMVDGQTYNYSGGHFTLSTDPTPTPTPSPAPTGDPAPNPSTEDQQAAFLAGFGFMGMVRLFRACLKWFKRAGTERDMG